MYKEFNVDYNKDISSDIPILQVLQYSLGILNEFHSEKYFLDQVSCGIEDLLMWVNIQKKEGIPGSKMGLFIYKDFGYNKFEFQFLSRNFDYKAWGMSDEEIISYEENYKKINESLFSEQNQELIKQLASLFEKAKIKAKKTENIMDSLPGWKETLHNYNLVHGDLDKIIYYLEDPTTTERCRSLFGDYTAKAVMLDDLIVCYLHQGQRGYIILDTSYNEKGNTSPVAYCDTIGRPKPLGDLIEIEGKDKWWFDQIHSYAEAIREKRKEIKDERQLKIGELNIKKND